MSARFVNPEDPDYEEWNRIFSGVAGGDVDALLQLLGEKSGRQLDVEFAGCQTLLAHAAAHSADMVNALIEKGADVNAKAAGVKDQTPLFAARGDAIKVLLEKETSQSVQNSDGDVPFTAAIARSDFAQAKEFLQQGMSLDVRDKFNNTVIFCAAAKETDPEGYSDEDAFWDYFEYKASEMPGTRRLALINGRFTEGNSPLHAAGERQKENACKTLLRLGAKQDAVNEEGQIPGIPPSWKENLQILSDDAGGEEEDLGFMDQPPPGQSAEPEGEAPKLPNELMESESGIDLVAGETPSASPSQPAAQAATGCGRDWRQLRKTLDQTLLDTEADFQAAAALVDAMEAEKATASVEDRMETFEVEGFDDKIAAMCSELGGAEEASAALRDALAPAKDLVTGDTLSADLDFSSYEGAGTLRNVSLWAKRTSEGVQVSASVQGLAFSEAQEVDLKQVYAYLLHKSAEKQLSVLQGLPEVAEAGDAPEEGQPDAPIPEDDRGEAGSGDEGGEEGDGGSERLGTGSKPRSAGGEEASLGMIDGRSSRGAASSRGEESRASGDDGGNAIDDDPDDEDDDFDNSLSEGMDEFDNEAPFLDPIVQHRERLAELQDTRVRLEERNRALQASYLAWKAQKDKFDTTGSGLGDKPQDGTRERSITEHKYSNVLQQVHSVRMKLREQQVKAAHMSHELKNALEEKRAKAIECRDSFRAFKRQVALQAEYSRTHKKIPKKVIQEIEDFELDKDQEVEEVRGSNISLKNRLAKLEQALRKKDELAENLHVIDFEQLKIENQNLNEKIEERNEELHRLKKKTVITVQIITHMREKLQFIQQENQKLKMDLAQLDHELASERDQVARTKHERDEFRSQNAKLRQQTGIINSDLLTRDYDERDAHIKNLHAERETLQKRHKVLQVFINKNQHMLDTSTQQLY